MAEHSTIVAVIVFAGVVVVCGFFLYVLLQFRRDEKHPAERSSYAPADCRAHAHAARALGLGPWRRPRPCVPTAQEEFFAKVQQWADEGAACPADPSSGIP